VSTALGLAAVTQVVKGLLQTAVDAFVTVTTKSPDKARLGQDGDQLNVFLFQVTPNAAWRNRDLPISRPNEAPRPLLALNLLYLLSSYGDSDDEVAGQQLLGRAMLFLHQNPMLDNTSIRSLLAGTDLAASGLENQVERVRFTLHPFSGEELARIWAGFKTEYRLTVAYEASVVLVEDDRGGRAALPVLTRGQDDRGVDARPGRLSSPYPLLNSVTLPTPVQLGIRLGEVLTLAGANLSGAEVQLSLRHPFVTPPRVVPVPPGQVNSDTIQFTLPRPEPGNEDWPAGLWSVSAVIVQRRPDPANPGAVSTTTRTTNEISFYLIPRVVADDPQGLPVQAGAGTDPSTVQLSIEPRLFSSQRVQGFLGDAEVAPQAIQDGATAMVFTLPVDLDLTQTVYVRIRVDGAESVVVDLDEYKRGRRRFDDRLRLRPPGGSP
jgi:hypothetical protein